MDSCQVGDRRRAQPATYTSPSAIVTSRALLLPVTSRRAGERDPAITSMRCTACGVTSDDSRRNEKPGRVRNSPRGLSMILAN